MNDDTVYGCHEPTLTHKRGIRLVHTKKDLPDVSSCGLTRFVRCIFVILWLKKRNNPEKTVNTHVKSKLN